MLLFIKVIIRKIVAFTQDHVCVHRKAEWPNTRSYEPFILSYHINLENQGIYEIPCQPYIGQTEHKDKRKIRSA